MTADPHDEAWLRQRTILGEDGQRRLADARVLVVGCGGLGAGAIPPLVASGIGTITLLDDDVVARSNLNRQTLFTAADIGRSKVELAARRMQALSPSANITGLEHRLTPDDVDLVSQFDVVVDCTDRAASRVSISTVCRAAQIPWVWAAIDAWSAVISVFAPGRTAWEDVVPHPTEAPSPPRHPGRCTVARRRVAGGRGREAVDRGRQPLDRPAGHCRPADSRRALRGDVAISLNQRLADLADARHNGPDSPSRAHVPVSTSRKAQS